MTPLTNKEHELYASQKKNYCICNEEFENTDDINYHRVRDHCHYTSKYTGEAHSLCNLRYKIPKEIPVVFYNVPNYDCQFII